MQEQRVKQAESMHKQSLALCNNYYYTGQHQKALSLLNQLRKMYPSDEITQHLLATICHHQFEVAGGDFAVMAVEIPDNQLSPVFGEHWTGQNLQNKSITIFCDQGMGDTIQLLRYVKQLKQSFECEVTINCYAYFNEMVKLMELQPYVDHFRKEYEKTDYHTNIMSIPAILADLKYEIYYPAHWRDLLSQTAIPDEPYLVKSEIKWDHMLKSIGVAWQSNRKNPLAAKKSFDPILFESLKSDYSLRSLHPEATDLDFINDDRIEDLKDLTDSIAELDLVISVDTVALHIAGALGKTAWGLLPYSADPRWGKDETTPWYPSVKLYRQKEPDNWQEVIERVAKDLHLWQNQEC